MGEVTEAMDAFQLFATECNDIDIEIRKHAMQNLSAVAFALNVERTTAELLPFLENLTEGVFNDDEVLMHLALELGNFLPLVGGPGNAQTILGILEKLASVEETLVRETAVDSLKIIANGFDSDTVEEQFVPLVLKLGNSEWFTSKCSAAALFAVCYNKVSAGAKADLRNAVRILCQDESPLVRRSTASKLPGFIKELEMVYVKDQFVPVFDDLANDDQDSVRILSVDVGIGIACMMTDGDVHKFVLDTLCNLCRDVSWRVRYQAARQINAIQLALGPSLAKNHLVSLYIKLSRDCEPQVREACAKNVVRFSEILKNNAADGDVEEIIVAQIVPMVRDLDDDDSNIVKETLASVITSLSSVLGERYTKTLLLPIITSSLTNASTRVKENIISNLNQLIAVVDVGDIAETLLGIIGDLVDNSASAWRTRRNLVITINSMAAHSDKDYFDSHLRLLYRKLLGDPVYAVRATAPLILPILARSFGMAWVRQSAAPDFLAFADHNHYLYRFVCLFCIDELLAPTVGPKSPPKYLASYEPLAPSRCKHHLYKLRLYQRDLKAKLAQHQEPSSALESIPNDNVKRYAEDAMDEFIRENATDVYEVSEEDQIGSGDETYLSGLLSITLNHFLPVLDKLLRDTVKNVRSRANKTLRNVIELNQALEEELDQAWVRQVLGTIDAEEAAKIDREVTEVGGKKDFSSDIESSDNYSEEDKSLVDEMMDVIDEKLPREIKQSD